MVVVFLLRGLHNEAGNTKFRNVRQYIAHMSHVGGQTLVGFRKEIKRYSVSTAVIKGIRRASLIFSWTGFFSSFPH